MRFFSIIIMFNILLFGGVLKEDNLPGIDMEMTGNAVRFVSTPETRTGSPTMQTNYFDKSRAQTLWVDRNHQFAIAQHTSISGNSMWIQAGWWLNNERTSLYRTLGTNIPNWSYLMPVTEWFIPVDVSISGGAIGVGGTGEPFYSFSCNSPAPQWLHYLSGNFKIATSGQGPTVVVSDDGAIYAFLARDSNEGRLYILDAIGDTIRTIAFNPNSGIYGLDVSDNGSVFCISTYYAIYIFNIDGTRRDSIANYGQTVAKISGDGKYFVKGDFLANTYFYRWDGSSYNLVWQDNTGHPWVTAVAIADDGSTIMAGTFQYSPTYSGKILMYDSSSAIPLWEYAQYGDYVAACALSADGSRGVAGSWGQYQATFGDVVTVFDKISATPVFQILDDIDEPGSIFSVDISEDGSFVTAGGKAVHAREMGNGGEVYAVRVLDPLTNDVGVKEINEPGSFLQVGQAITPQTIVMNYGTATANFNTVCNIYDSLTNLLYTDTISVSNLAASAEQTLDFSPIWTVPAYGKYETVVFTTLSGDGFPANDTLIRGSICYHDGVVIFIGYPFAELTLNYTKSPRVSISNKGSYAENIPVTCEIYNPNNILVYTGNGQAFLNPLQSATIFLTPTWTPSDTGLYTAYFFTQVSEDYLPANDTMMTSTNITTEILYDDGVLDIYGYVSNDFYDNKFAEKMIPCLTPPYYINRARFYTSSADPITMSLNSDSAGLPGLGPLYYIAPAETIYPAQTGWAIKNYIPPIQMTNANPFWLVVHWLSGSPNAPYIGMDNTIPRDSLSYWYWTEPSNPGWHIWTWYDFMMRVNTISQTGIDEQSVRNLEKFALDTPAPNPFVENVNLIFSIPRKGLLKVKIYDVSGRMVREFLNCVVDPGEYRVNWDGLDNKGRRLSSGVYLLKADYEKETINKKLVLIAE